MARRKKRMFKQIALIKAENIGHTGSWNPIAKLEKQQDQMTAAWVDKVRISYKLDVSGSDTGNLANTQPLGVVFTASTASSAPVSATLLSATGTRGGGGTVTLDISRLIRDNDYDADSGFGAIAIHVATTDPDLTAGDITGTFVIEAFGRWHNVLNI